MEKNSDSNLDWNISKIFGIWDSKEKTGLLYTHVGWETIIDNDKILKKVEFLEEKPVNDINYKKLYWYKDILSKIISSLIMRSEMKKIS